jgi:membrane protein
MLSGARIWAVLKDTVQEWIDDNAARVAASLAFYTLLSLAPLVILTIALAGVVMGEDTARDRIIYEVGQLVGPEGAKTINAVVASAHQSNDGVLSTVIGLIVLFVGASGVFGELQYAMNTIWGVKPKQTSGLMLLVRERVFSFAMVIAVAFLLLVSLVVSAVLSGIGRFMAGSLPGGDAVWQVVNVVLSIGIITALFGLIFKVVPDVEVRWRDVWVGALATAVLFTVGKQLLGIYLGKSSVASAYGAAGSIVALVVWVYYSSQLVFFGAEFTQVYARAIGRTITPSKHAEFVDAADRAPATALRAEAGQS